jgi:aspartyl-tRNA(Asn)/glutamyl-tRNA(Gln) amidotransferase subunit B
MEITPEWIDEVKRSMPPLPAEARADFERMGVPVTIAALLAESREKADFFRNALKATNAPPVMVANWTVGEIAALVNDRNVDFADVPVDPSAVGRLLAITHDGTISHKAAKEVLLAMADGDGDPDAIVAKRGLKQISDSGALESAVEKVVAAQPKLVEDYLSGKEKAFNALVGQVMKATGGKANPQEVSRLLKARLG